MIRFVAMLAALVCLGALPAYSQPLSLDASHYQKTETPATSPYQVGDIVIITHERKLYYLMENNRAIVYPVGVGRPGFTWARIVVVSDKKEWPSWTPPEEMIERQPNLPRYMTGGPGNPLGARAIYLGSTLYRIHGTNKPESVGEAESSGCFRMRNEDVAELYDRVTVGKTKVFVLK